MHGGHRNCVSLLTGGAPPTLRPGGRKSEGWRPGPLCMAGGGPSGSKLEKMVHLAKQKLWRHWMHLCNDLFTVDEA